MRKLNLGCGHEVLEDWENYDLYSDNPQVKKLDLNILPLPFENDSIDKIRINHVLEHLIIHPYDMMKELHRILKPNGELYIGLPGYSHILTHMRGFHPICYMDEITSDYGVNKHYVGVPLFKLIKLKNNFNWRVFFRKAYETIIAMGSDNMEWTMRKGE